MSDPLDMMIRALESANAASTRAGIVDDETNASKLFYQELGTITIPARPTITRSYDEDRIMAEAEKALGDAMGGGPSLVDGVAKIGDDLAARTREAIRSNTPPPLAESTIEARRARGNTSTATLIDTGEMLAAVTSQAKAGAGEW